MKKKSTQIQKQTKKHRVSQSHLKTKIGLWINGKTYWIQDGSERLLMGESVSIKIQQTYIHSNVRLSNIYVTNQSEQPKELKLFIMHYHENSLVDHFTFISPTERVIFHLADRSVYLVTGQMNGVFMNEYSVQPFWNVKTDEFWNSENKGTLRYQPMYRGPACSIFSLKTIVPGFTTSKGNTWIITGDRKSNLIRLNQAVITDLSISALRSE